MFKIEEDVTISLVWVILVNMIVLIKYCLFLRKWKSKNNWKKMTDASKPQKYCNDKVAN